MKKLEQIKLFFTVGLLAVIAVTACLGLRVRHGDILLTQIRGYEDIVWGVDIRGGIQAAFTPSAGMDVTDSDIRSTASILQQRMELLKLKGEVTVSIPQRRIQLTLPHQYKEGYRPIETLTALTAPGRFTLREYTRDAADGQMNGRVILDSRDIDAVLVRPNAAADKQQLLLLLTEEGSVKLADAVERLSTPAAPVAYWLDDRLLSIDVLSREMTRGQLLITQDLDLRDTIALARAIRIGMLPFPLAAQQLSLHDPAEGTAAKNTLIQAGAFTFLLMTALLIVRGRLPGLVGCVGLIYQLILTLAGITGYFAFLPGLVLTLPGMVGVIVSMAIGVNGTLLVARRIKEELLAGKNLDFAITTGFRRSYSTVLAIDLMILAACFLFMGAYGTADDLPVRVLSPLFSLFGTMTDHTIYAFANTLFIGTLAALVTDLPIASMLLGPLSKWQSLRDPILYGGVRDD